MYKAIFATLIAATAAISAQAVTFTSAPGAPDPGPAAGQTNLINFDAALPAGVTLTGNYALVTGTVAGQYAAPAGDTTRYLVIPGNGTNGTADLQFGNIYGPVTSLSFYLGSIDTYNTISFLNGNSVIAGGTFTGGQFPPAVGDQASAGSNRRIFFTFAPSEMVTGIRFASSNIALEVDSIAIAGVPEPRTWAMLILGFGMVGAAMRRRHPDTVSA